MSPLSWDKGGLRSSGLFGPLISNIISFNLLMKVLETNHRHYTELKTGTEDIGNISAGELVVSYL